MVHHVRIAAFVYPMTPHAHARSSATTAAFFVLLFVAGALVGFAKKVDPAPAASPGASRGATGDARWRYRWWPWHARATSTSWQSTASCRARVAAACAANVIHTAVLAGRFLYASFAGVPPPAPTSRGTSDGVEGRERERGDDHGAARGGGGERAQVPAWAAQEGGEREAGEVWIRRIARIETGRGKDEGTRMYTTIHTTTTTTTRKPTNAERELVGSRPRQSVRAVLGGGGGWVDPARIRRACALSAGSLQLAVTSWGRAAACR